MSVFGRRLIVKVGGEGVFCAGFPDRGLGAIVICDDGAGRAAEAMMAAVIVSVLGPGDPDMKRFAHRLRPPVLSRNGGRVGEVRPSPALVDALVLGR
jgi:L-asparaginase II